MNSSSAEPWYAAAFGADYLARYAHRDREEALLAVQLLLHVAPVAADQVLFDLCCGAGRHLQLLREHAASFCAGGDLSADLLRHARTQSDDLPLLRLDMRALPLRDQSVHVLTNFFTAFGYFDDDRENLAVLEEVARVLVPGGWFMLDFLNAERIASELAEPFAGEQLDCNGGRWLVRKWIEAGRVRKSQTPLGHNAAPREESVRLFRAEDFATSLFPAAGLRVIQTFGDYHGAPASPSAPRHIVLARRD